MSSLRSAKARELSKTGPLQAPLACRFARLRFLVLNLVLSGPGAQDCWRAPACQSPSTLFGAFAALFSASASCRPSFNVGHLRVGTLEPRERADPWGQRISRLHSAFRGSHFVLTHQRPLSCCSPRLRITTHGFGHAAARRPCCNGLFPIRIVATDAREDRCEREAEVAPARYAVCLHAQHRASAKQKRLRLMTDRNRRSPSLGTASMLNDGAARPSARWRTKSSSSAAEFAMIGK